MLNRVVRTGFVAAVASGVFWASPGLAMRDVALQDASSGTEAPSPTQSTVLSRFQVSLHRGDPGYDWVSALAGNLVMAESIAFSVSYPARESWVQSLRPEEAILINGAFENPAGASKGIGDGFSNPREPDGTGRPGSVEINHMYCTTVNVGTLPRAADVEYVWEWQFREDTNGDGKNDADPGWVLTDVKVHFLPEIDAAAC